jgi:hypothetical protein
MIGGVAATAAVRTWPFRVYSFPSEPIAVNCVLMPGEYFDPKTGTFVRLSFDPATETFSLFDPSYQIVFTKSLEYEDHVGKIRYVRALPWRT